MNTGSYKCCTPSTKEASQVETLASILKIVADPSRLKLLCILRQSEHCVSEIMEHVDFSQSLVSHHLRDLKDIGVVKDEKRGQRSYYYLTDSGRRITNTLFQIVEKGH